MRKGYRLIAALLLCLMLLVTLPAVSPNAQAATAFDGGFSITVDAVTYQQMALGYDTVQSEKTLTPRLVTLSITNYANMSNSTCTVSVTVDTGYGDKLINASFGIGEFLCTGQWTGGDGGGNTKTVTGRFQSDRYVSGTDSEGGAKYSYDVYFWEATLTYTPRGSHSLAEVGNGGFFATTTAPTCQTEGSGVAHCTNIACSYSENVAIPVNPDAHKWGSWTDQGDGTHKRSCTVAGCTETQTEDCDYAASTCTEPEKCKTCGGTKAGSTPRGHGGFYSVSGNTISMDCFGCDAVPTARLSAGSNLSYNGASRPATVIYSSDWNGPRDFTVSYDRDPVNAGQVTASFTYAGAETGVDLGSMTTQYQDLTATLTYTIEPAVLTVTPTAGQKKPYDGAMPESITYGHTGAVAGQTPAFSGALAISDVNAGSYPITQGTLALQDNGSFLASNYTLKIAAGVNYTVEKLDNQWTVQPAITGWTYGQTPGQATAAAREGQVSVSYIGRDGTAYESDTLPVNAGKYTAVFTADGGQNYNKLTKSVDFEITAAQLQDSWLITGEDEFTYNGAVQCPAVMLDGLTAARDYAVSITNEKGQAVTEPKAAGSYTLTVTGCGNYTGELTRTFTIEPFAVTITPAAGQGKTYGAEDPELVCTLDKPLPAGEALNAPLVRKAGENAGVYPIRLAPAAKNPNYTITLADGEHIFQIEPASLTVKGLEAEKVYDGTGSTESLLELAVVFKGMPITDDLVLGTDILVSNLTLQPKADGYHVGTSYVLVADITMADTELGRNYTLTNGSDFEGTVEITPRPISQVTVAAIADVTYSGAAQKPDISATWGSLPALVAGTDYTLSYQNNTDAGQATVTVTGKGDYSGSREVSFTVLPAALEQSWLEAEPAEFTYNAAAQSPDVTVEDSEDHGKLKQDTDYTVSYTDSKGAAVTAPTDAGTYTLTVTGKGNFTGSATATFEIKPLAITVTPDEDQGKVYGDTEPELTYTLSKTLPGGETLTNPLKRQQGEDVGSYAITLAAADTNPNYTVTLAQGSFTFEITPLALTDANTTVTGADLEFTGAEQDLTPTVKVTLPGGETETLTSADITVTGNKGTAVGTYTVTVTGKGNFSGSITVKRKITPDAAVLDAVVNGTVTEDNVSLTQKADLEALKAALDSVTASTEATDAEKQAWEAAAGKLPDLLEKLEELDDALNTKDHLASLEITPTTVVASDRDTLDDGKKDIQAYLFVHADNVTDAEKAALQAQIAAIDACLAELDKAQPTIDAVTKWLKDNAAKFDADELELRKEYAAQLAVLDALPENTKRIAREALAKDLENARAKLFTYTVTARDSARWILDSGKDMTFVANGHIDLFDSIEVDGRMVSYWNYTTKSGSTIITLKNSFMKTLKKGNHTIVVNFTDGSTESYTFQVGARTIIPATGDQIMTAVTVMAVSAAAIVILLVLMKKRRK